jgi:hypothetical protein
MIEPAKELEGDQCEQFGRLFDDGKVRGLPDSGSFGTSWRFSTGLGRASRLTGIGFCE